MAPVYDGFISKHINRKLSEPIARMLARTRLTPNQATWGAFAIAALSFASFVMGYNILGGILAQLSSIADGIDGSLARLKGMSSAFGSFLDSVLDRYADALIVLGMTWWALSHEGYPLVWLVGFLAIVGTLSVSYTRARIDPEHRLIFDKGLPSIASHDIRLFLNAGGYQWSGLLLPAGDSHPDQPGGFLQADLYVQIYRAERHLI